MCTSCVLLTPLVQIPATVVTVQRPDSRVLLGHAALKMGTNTEPVGMQKHLGAYSFCGVGPP